MATTFPTNARTELLVFRYFATLPDPRFRRARRHPLMTLLFIILCATISGADTFAQMERWAHAKKVWLEQQIDLSAGIPTHDTIGRLFARLNPNAFATCFDEWVQALHRHTKGEVIAIDGKTVRGSRDDAMDSPALHLISAFATKNRLALCQEVVAGHENEITAVPTLLSLLDVEDCIVTADAMLCQKDIAAQVIDQGGDYALALKENHPHLHDSTQEFFAYWRSQGWKTEQDGVPIAHQFAQTVGKGHGRIEIRTCCVAEAAQVAPWLVSAPTSEDSNDSSEDTQDEVWKGLRSIAAVTCERRERHKTTTFTRYFLTSLSGPNAAEDILRATRQHWGIENRLHWCLDVVMREDDHQLRGRRNARSAVRNMALLRKMVLNLLRKGGDLKDSLRGKRDMSGWNTDYLEAVLAGTTFTTQATER